MLTHTQTMDATCTSGGFYEANDSLTQCTVNLICGGFIRVVYSGSPPSSAI